MRFLDDYTIHCCLVLNALYNFYFYLYKNLKILKISVGVNVLKKMIVLKNLNAVVKII